jgi:hypothetical protein
MEGKRSKIRRLIAADFESTNFEKMFVDKHDGKEIENQLKKRITLYRVLLTKLAEMLSQGLVILIGKESPASVVY